MNFDCETNQMAESALPSARNAESFERPFAVNVPGAINQSESEILTRACFFLPRDVFLKEQFQRVFLGASRWSN